MPGRSGSLDGDRTDRFCGDGLRPICGRAGGLPWTDIDDDDGPAGSLSGCRGGVPVSGALWIDPKDLGGRGAAWQEIGVEVGQVAVRPWAVLADEGRWWGDDEAGEAVAKTYEPDAGQGLVALQNFAESGQGFGTEVKAAAETFRSTDHEGGRRVERTLEPEGTSGSVGDMSAEPARTPAAAKPNSYAAPSSYLVSRPVEFVPIGTEAAPARHIGAPDDIPDSGGETNSPGVVGSQTASGSAANSGDRIAGPDGRQSADSARTSSATTPGTRRRPIGPSGDENRVATPPTRGPPSSATEPARGGPSRAAGPARASAPPAAVSAPMGRKPPGTPWSDTICAAPPAGRPDRISAGKSAADRSSAPGAKRSDRDRPERTPQPVNRSNTDSDPVRLVRELADRHRVEVTGLDAPGIDEDAVGGFLADTDDVLTKSPVIEVRRVGIAELEQRKIVRVEQQSAFGAQEQALTWSAVVDIVQLTDPARLPDGIPASGHPAAVVTQADTRPIYAATLRELAWAIDRAGARQARARAQRALIAEYFGDHGAYRRVSPARVVHGYQYGRDRLSGGCVDMGRFDPAAALPDAFTDVVLNAEGATEPVKTLCRLHVDTARRPATRDEA
ncbi:hypothetical protein [Nocardia sputi]|uniref:hypothetical protein n=1 Tax=Nocardia sputi TaxID=2943705 RepID=UPI0020BEDAD9|nr:hypothetical protein [Nocardia sputi]